jgi:Acyl-CoA carboxylase epsilon subunit
MTDNPSQDPQAQDPQGQEAPGTPLRLVRGNASPEELAALVALLAAIPALATGEDVLDPADRSASRWSTRRRVFHSTYPHGPGGWRASAFPH